MNDTQINQPIIMVEQVYEQTLEIVNEQMNE